MQNRTQKNFKERSIFFLNFKHHGLPEKLRNDVMLAYTDGNEQFSDKWRMVYITIPLMNKKEGECVNNFERWIYVMTNMEQLDEIPYKQQIKELLDFETIADFESLQETDRARYEAELKNYRDTLATYSGAREEGFASGREEGFASGREEGIAYGIKKGIKEGIEKGIEKGIKEGIEKGLEKGREERSFQIALSLKNSNVPLDIIVSSTGLTPEQIAALN